MPFQTEFAAFYFYCCCSAEIKNFAVRKFGLTNHGNEYASEYMTCITHYVSFRRRNPVNLLTRRRDTLLPTTLSIKLYVYSHRDLICLFVLHEARIVVLTIASSFLASQLKHELASARKELEKERRKAKTLKSEIDEVSKNNLEEIKKLRSEIESLKQEVGMDNDSSRGSFRLRRCPSALRISDGYSVRLQMEILMWQARPPRKIPGESRL
jgi:hypothetical protein